MLLNALKHFRPLIGQPCAVFAAVLIAYSAPGYSDTDYPNIELSRGQADKNTDWYKMCLSVKDVSPPSKDIPSERLAATLMNCDSIGIYYEVKNNTHASASDWKRVRDCAFSRNDDAVLMMLYANGYGVSRNIDTAIKYACKFGGSSSEVEARVSNLSDMRDVDSGNFYDLCESDRGIDAKAMCADISNRQIEKKRKDRLAAITQKWTASQKLQFSHLQTAFSNFVALLGPNETDQLATNRAEEVDETIATEKEQFLTDLEEFEKGYLPSFTNEQFVESDKNLNQVYQELMHAQSAGFGSRLGFSTITKEAIKETQKAWLKYRDAWVSFGHVKYPSVDAKSWMGFFSDQRVKHLKELLVYANER